MSEWIVCPVTGRKWPAIKRTELRTCSACGALIDIRHEAWMDGPAHTPGDCPTAPRARTPALPAPPAGPKPTGEEMLALMDTRRDRVHEAALERASTRAKDGHQ